RDRVRCEDHVADEVSHLARIVKQLLRGGGDPALVESDVVQAVLHTSHARQAHEGDCEQQNEQGAESDTQAGADAITSKKIHWFCFQMGECWRSRGADMRGRQSLSVTAGITAGPGTTGASGRKNVNQARLRFGSRSRKKARHFRRASRD